MRRNLAVAVAVTALLAGLLTIIVANASAPASAATSYTNPIRSSKGADPWLTYHNGNYYLMATTWTSVLTMRKSPTLAGLATAPTVQVWASDNANRCCNIWAPEFHLLNGPNGQRWYIYYTAGQNVSDYVPTQRIHVLESAGTDPMGPYTYRGTLIDPANNTWQLDGNILQVGGRLYLLGTYHDGSTQNLFIMPMSNPWTLSGGRVRLSTPTHAWERQTAPVQEGPEALYHNGRTFIIYSASACWSADYKLGMLTYTGSNPLDPAAWTKAPQPVFQRNDANGVYGPGHNGFFKSPDGTQDWIVYHANDNASEGCDNGRTTRAQRFTWNSDGTPNFGTPVRLGTTLAAPSGETAATPTSFTLVNRNSGKCLDVQGGSTADGANVVQWTCDGSADQRWRVEDQGDDTNRLVNVGTGKVVDVADCASADGADIRQWSWLNNSCQRFRVVSTDQGGWVRLQNLATGKVADVADCGTADGADVRQWTWLGNTCQQWQIRPV